MLVNTGMPGDNLESQICHLSIVEDSVAKCHRRCLAHPECQSYMYITEAFASDSCKKNCFLKSLSIEGNTEKAANVVTGPKWCTVEF